MGFGDDNMASMFNKDTPKSCEWCKFSKKSAFNKDLFCAKRGVTEKFNVCRKYKYDPLKRTPEKTSFVGNFTKSDFKI